MLRSIHEPSARQISHYHCLSHKGQQEMILLHVFFWDEAGLAHSWEDPSTHFSLAKHTFSITACQRYPTCSSQTLHGTQSRLNTTTPWPDMAEYTSVYPCPLQDDPSVCQPACLMQPVVDSRPIYDSHTKASYCLSNNLSFAFKTTTSFIMESAAWARSI